MTKIHWLLILFCGISLGCGGSSKQADLADLYLRMGTANLAKGNNAHALRDLAQAEKLDDSNHLIQNNLGLAYFVNGNLESAKTHLNKAISIKDDYSDARNNLGRVLIEQSQFKEAREHLDQVVQDLTYSGREKALFNIGLIEFLNQRYLSSEAYFLRAMDIKRDYCLAQSYYGRSLFERDLYGRASRVLDKAVPSCQKLGFDEPHFFSALSHFKKGNIDGAVARLEEVETDYRNGRYSNRASNLLAEIRKKSKKR